MSQFVLMYHPQLGNARASVSLASVDDHAAVGWLLVDGQTPTPSAKYLTPTAGDSRYLIAEDVDDPASPSGSALRAEFLPRDEYTPGGGGGTSGVFTETATAPTPVADAEQLFATDVGGVTSLRMISPTGLITDLQRDDSFIARNQTGTTIPKGTIVYEAGVSSSSYGVPATRLPLIAPARADAAATAIVLGVTMQPIPTNGSGRVMTEGMLTGVDTSAYSNGARLWLSKTTAGAFTATRPEAPVFEERVALVVRSHATEGQLFVTVKTALEKGLPNGLASLGADARLPEAQVPTRLSDVELRAASVAAVEAEVTVTPTGVWDFAQAPTVAGQPIGTDGSVTVSDASTTTKGIVELATNTETTTGTDTARAVTPAGVAAALAALTIPDSPDDIGAQPAGSYVADSDPRLSDARTPVAHGHAAADVTGLATVATSGAYTDLTGVPDTSAYVTSTSIDQIEAVAEGTAGSTPGVLYIEMPA